MQRLYKKITVYTTNKSAENPGDGVYQPSKLASLLQWPIILAGALAGMVFISALVGLLLIPGSIIAFLGWRRFKKMREQFDRQNLDAEYTVIEDTDKK